VGLSALEEQIYRTLLRRGGGSAAEIIGSINLPERAARAALVSLEHKGMVVRSTSRPKVYVAAPPQVAIDLLILRRQEELEQVRLAASELTAEAGSEVPGPDSTDIVEVVAGGEGVRTRNYQLLMGAQREILGFDVPPRQTPDERFIQFKLDILARGVKGQVVYTPEILETPEMLKFIEALRPAGEEPRMAAELPMPLLIVDRSLAFVPARADKKALNDDFLVVHPSCLLDSLLSLFQRVWDHAAPFEPGAPMAHPVDANDEQPLLSPDDSRIIAMLGAGMKDTAIALQLGIGERTAHRHIRRIMDLLGTSTRFQTGAEANRRGWLGRQPTTERPEPEEPRPGA